MADRSLKLPTEIVDHILSYLEEPPQCPLFSSFHAPLHADLRKAALVSRQWRDAARRLLFGRLTVDWRSGVASKLLQTFEDNPHLYELVRYLSVRYTGEVLWRSNWRDSDAGEDAREAAAELYPDQAGSGYENWGPDFEEFFEEAFEDAAEASGDGDWLWSDTSGRREGADKLWQFIARLSNLRALDMRDNDELLSGDVLREVVPVLSGLTHVAFSSENAEDLSFISLLSSAHTLRLSIPANTLVTLPPLATSSGSLKYLQVQHQGTPDVWPFENLASHLPTLIGLSLPHTDHSLFMNITDLLPLSTNLRYLEINQPAQPTPPLVYDKFYNALRHLALTHLYLDTMPNVSQLHSLPSTIIALELNLIRYAKVPDNFLTISTWKELYMPSLERVSITTLNFFDAFSPLIKDLTEKSTTFLVQSRSDFPQDPLGIPGLFWSGV